MPSKVEGMARQCPVRSAAAQGMCAVGPKHHPTKEKSAFYFKRFFLERCFIKNSNFIKHRFAIMLNSSCLGYAFLLI